MAIRPKAAFVRLAALAFIGFAAAPAVASAHGAEADGVIDELPANPPAGTCYARVKVLAEQGPPPGPRAVWKQTPALPGAMGPTWCLVMEPGVAPPPVPEHLGWVKVLCDSDATPARIKVIQSKLRDHGDYAGEETGRYDQATADAVARFQQDQHIDHGGVLSLTTVEAIQRAEVRRAAAQGDAIHVPCCKTQLPPPPPPPPPVQIPVPYPVRVEVPVPQPYPVEVRVPQPYPVYVPVPQPCCAAPPPRPQPCCVAPPAPPQPCCVAPPPSPCCTGGGYPHGRGYLPAPMGRDQNGWLSWPGKTVF